METRRYLMTKATRDSLAYFHKFCAKICLDDREFSVNYFTFIFHFATTKNYLVMPQPIGSADGSPNWIDLQTLGLQFCRMSISVWTNQDDSKKVPKRVRQFECLRAWFYNDIGWNFWATWIKISFQRTSFQCQPFNFSFTHCFTQCELNLKSTDSLYFPPS